MKTRTIQIMLVSLIQKITNLITTLDFIQSEPVSDVVKGTTYKLYFLSEDHEKISNENIYVADKRDDDVQKRLFRLRFTFKNKKYDKSKQGKGLLSAGHRNLQIINQGSFQEPGIVYLLFFCNPFQPCRESDICFDAFVVHSFRLGSLFVVQK